MPRSGSVQGQNGWGFEQPDLVKGVPGHGREVKLDDLQGHFKSKPSYDSHLLFLLCSEWHIVHFVLTVWLALQNSC